MASIFQYDHQEVVTLRRSKIIYHGKIGSFDRLGFGIASTLVLSFSLIAKCWQSSSADEGLTTAFIIVINTVDISISIVDRLDGSLLTSGNALLIFVIFFYN